MEREVSWGGNGVKKKKVENNSRSTQISISTLQFWNPAAIALDGFINCTVAVY